jgi:hypothetical protein
LEEFEGIPLKIFHIGNGHVNFVSFVTRMVAEEGDDEIIRYLIREIMSNLGMVPTLPQRRAQLTSMSTW